MDICLYVCCCGGTNLSQIPETSMFHYVHMYVSGPALISPTSNMYTFRENLASEEDAPSSSSRTRGSAVERILRSSFLFWSDGLIGNCFDVAGGCCTDVNPQTVDKAFQ